MSFNSPLGTHVVPIKAVGAVKPPWRYSRRSIRMNFPLTQFSVSSRGVKIRSTD